MRIVITGGKGMLGRTLQQVLKQHDVIVADLPEMGHHGCGWLQQQSKSRQRRCSHPLRRNDRR